MSVLVSCTDNCGGGGSGLTYNDAAWGTTYFSVSI